MVTEDEEVIRYLKDTQEEFRISTKEFKSLSPTVRNAIVRGYLMKGKEWYRTHDLTIKQKISIAKVVKKI